jgi:hypothetical protein
MCEINCMDFERIADEGDEEHEFERVEDSFDFEIVDDEEDEDHALEVVEPNFEAAAEDVGVNELHPDFVEAADEEVGENELDPNVEGVVEEEDDGLEEKEKKKVVKAMHCLGRCALFILFYIIGLCIVWADVHYWSMHLCALLIL